MDVNAPNSEITLRFLSEPSDVNFGGNVHGGMVMKWIDQAGYTCAANWTGQYCVTVYVSGIRFYKPIFIGDLVEINAKVIYTGRTSLHVGIDVFAGKPQSHEKRKTTHCVIVFVAMGKDAQPLEVPKWMPTTEEEIALEKYAIRLKELTGAIEEEMKKQGLVLE